MNFKSSIKCYFKSLRYGRLRKTMEDIYKIGAVTSIIVLCGIILDMVVGNITGGNIAELPQTAIERFNQFKETPLLGLYNLDLLNIINQIILIPSIFALYAAHRESNKSSALLSLILFLVGTTIFVTGNTALTMLDLSQKYFAASSRNKECYWQQLEKRC